MGRGFASQISDQLIRHGRAPKTMVSLVANVGRADETAIITPLEDLKSAVEQLSQKAPVIMIIGARARKAHSINQIIEAEHTEISVNASPIANEKEISHVA